MRGCRAPEVASGVLFYVLNEAFTSSLGRLAVSWRPVLTTAEWTGLLSEFNRGKSHLVYIVTLKMAHWQELPWLLCQVGHYDETIAREGAKKALAKFTAFPSAEVNHRLTMDACHPDTTLGIELREFVKGKPRQELASFHAFGAGLANIPITERRKG